MLHILLALPRLADIGVVFVIDETLQAISCGESTDQPFAVFPRSAGEIVGYADIQSAVWSVG
jgi:hypothetical protein